jgi:hypothetical protein
MAYKFHQPIRYYKANDPYYYEVDNLPVRQLEENILFIKNKLEGPKGGSGGGYLTETSELSIYNIKELRPKSSGGRTINVNAGRFNSRINDAYNIGDTLASLVYDSVGPGGSEPVLIPALRNMWTEVQRDAVWNSFIISGEKPYNVNGLEIAFTFYSSPGGEGGNWGWNTTSERGANYPKYNMSSQSHRWPGMSNFGPLVASQLGPVIEYNNQYTYENLPSIHLAFVKKWRGVFRTSVVDFPEQTIEIPAFDEWDYYYRSTGEVDVVIPNATQRIDLLVAYSVPIDASSTTRPSYEETFCQIGGTPKPKLETKPMLGLVRGAGVGIQKNNTNVVPSISTKEGCPPDKGTPGSARIAGNINDTQATANLGITDSAGNVIHGSFPSPDDLLNIAPLLAIDVDDDDLQLVGQAALPIAYIVVKQGQANITQADIIDIRPFLRTTEFTYNERAGVAGANPPLSLANPAVGLFQLQDVTKKIYTSLYGSIIPTSEIKDGKILYTDYVMGGLAYGPEGTLLSMNANSSHTQDPWGTTTQNAGLTYGDTTYTFSQYTSNKAFLEEATITNKEALLQYFYNNRQADLKVWLSDPNSSFNVANGTYLGLPGGTEGRNIPLYPEWDQPYNSLNQASVMTGAQKSAKVTWWMFIEGWSAARQISYLPGGVASIRGTKDQSANWLDVDFNPSWGSTKFQAMIVTNTKRIEIILPDWAQDYDVLVEYVNCGPLTSTSDPTAGGSSAGTNKGLGSGLYVNKGPVVSTPQKSAVFYINSASQPIPESNGGICDGRVTDEEASNGNNCDGTRKSPPGPNAAYDWLSYQVCLPQFTSTAWGMNQQGDTFNNTTRFAPKFGMCFYPTVKFSVVAYKELVLNRNSNLGAANNYTLIETAGNSGDILSPTAPLYTGTVVDLS